MDVNFSITLRSQLYAGIYIFVVQHKCTARWRAEPRADDVYSYFLVLEAEY